MAVQWFALDEVLGRHAGAEIGRLCQEMMRSWLGQEPLEVLRRQWLAELAAALSASWAAIWQAEPDWVEQEQLGQRPSSLPSAPVLKDALDREAVGLYGSSGTGRHTLIVPLQRTSDRPEVLLFARAGFSVDEAVRAGQLGYTLGWCLQYRRQRDRLISQVDLYRRLAHVVGRFAAASETSELLSLIAQGATELLACERASIFIWDREHHQLVACPALGVEGGRLRLADDVGIVGQVIRTGRPVRVDDAYQDPRFDRSVDQRTGYRTRNILCVPVRDANERLLGAFQALNKRQGQFTELDQECLLLLGQQASVALESTRERERLLRSHQQLTAQAAAGVQLIGQSAAMEGIRKTVERLAFTDLPVLILGESGTGKEVVARALHYCGSRAGRPFVAVNCAALTESLLESELFGYEKGAFTDARETRPGKFEVADGGTLFLDEIGEMSKAGQAKLLRVLEQKTVSRVGGNEEIPVDVRVIAATNTDLEKAVRENRFRQDLYYRLNVVVIKIPPLRERPEDVVPLAEHFLAEFARQAGRPPLRLTSQAKQRLQQYAWPGNVRELRNLMERFAFLSSGPQIDASDVGFLLTSERDTDLPLAAATRRFQQEYIRRAIKRAGGNMSEAAKLLGLHRANLYRKMKQLGMNEGRRQADDEALQNEGDAARLSRRTPR